MFWFGLCVFYVVCIFRGDIVYLVGNSSKIAKHFFKIGKIRGVQGGALTILALMQNYVIFRS